jgi:hypothetical protein
MKAIAIKEENLIKQIQFIRGEKVLLDYELANLYGVQTKRLKEAVKRNIKRFPSDFMFELTREELNNLRTQIATSNKRGGIRYLPFAFTELGVAMLSSVLNSKRAIQVNITIMRTFVQIRKLISGYKELSEKINNLEEKHDKEFKKVYEIIGRFIQTEAKPKSIIGFS